MQQQQHQQQQQQQQQQQPLVGTRKRRVMTAELLARFQSKEDFTSYMTNQLQLYVPPEKMLNRDFIKQLLAEDK